MLDAITECNNTIIIYPTWRFLKEFPDSPVALTPAPHPRG